MTAFDNMAMELERFVDHLPPISIDKNGVVVYRALEEGEFNCYHFDQFRKMFSFLTNERFNLIKNKVARDIARLDIEIDLKFMDAKARLHAKYWPNASTQIRLL